LPRRRPVHRRAATFVSFGRRPRYPHAQPAAQPTVFPANGVTATLRKNGVVEPLRAGVAAPATVPSRSRTRESCRRTTR
jgi:hypothetical protein